MKFFSSMGEPHLKFPFDFLKSRTFTIAYSICPPTSKLHDEINISVSGISKFIMAKFVL